MVGPIDDSIWRLIPQRLKAPWPFAWNGQIDIAKRCLQRFLQVDEMEKECQPDISLQELRMSADLRASRQNGLALGVQQHLLPGYLPQGTVDSGSGLSNGSDVERCCDTNNP